MVQPGRGGGRGKGKSCDGKTFRIFLVFWGWKEQPLVRHVNVRRNVFCRKAAPETSAPAREALRSGACPGTDLTASEGS